MEKESVIEKIRKLLALATNNSNVNEAAAAAAMAQDLQYKHKISVAEVEASGGDEDDDEVIHADLHAPGLKWRDSLVHGVAHAFYCKSITLNHSAKRGEVRKGTVRIVGKTSDTQTAAYMYQYLVNEVERLAKEEEVRYRYENDGHLVHSIKSYLNSFRVGAVMTIRERLGAQREAQDKANQPESTALVLRNDALAVNEAYRTMYPKIQKTKGPTCRANGGFARGQEAGRGVSLGGSSKGLGAAPKQLKA